MRVKIDEDACTGCGVCESLCPDVFKIEEDEKAHIINPDDCNGCDCQEVIDSCPTQAILIEEE
ncbi:ferredoxin [candidate division WOR-3 bacterium]|nr:ferredoxin [candidate division WOR-3 bacterium]